jgi:hypothetical protein
VGLLFLLFLSCTPPVADKAGFENIWWGVEGFDACFNVSDDPALEEPSLLVYEQMTQTVYNYGSWHFKEPNTYIFEIYKVTVEENGECWLLNWTFRTSEVCACELIE